MAVIVLLSAIVALALGQRVPLRPIPENINYVPTTPVPPVFNGTYWLTMSSKVRPGTAFQVSAQLLEGEDPVDVTVIFQDQFGKKNILESPAFTVTPGDIQTFGIAIPLDIEKPREVSDMYWYDISYNVLVKGVGRSINFKHAAQIKYEEKSFSTFIQTDKGMYKPGQKGGGV
ncbi:hypothetical protein EGW08_002095, partial [Elysia chlorotica]